METMLNETKTAFIIAGPNGSGKTTFSISLLENTDILTGAHLNADIIAKAYMSDDDYKDLTPLQVHLKVSQLVEKTIDDLIEQGSNIILETVFSSKYKLDTYKKLKYAGYFVTVVFVSTNDPMINVLNVASRVRSGGHDVPIDKILSRYDKSIENVKLIAKDVDCLILIDNSVMNHSPIIHSALSKGSVCLDNGKDKPRWIQGLLDGIDEVTQDEEKVAVCNQIQSVLDNEFMALVELETDDVLNRIQKTNS
ncbi:MAG: zeta toxin family protein [Campylobacterota bacterium]|nr:zeta toxin family protein [Campylobacterota bacterium]